MFFYNYLIKYHNNIIINRLKKKEEKIFHNILKNYILTFLLNN